MKRLKVGDTVRIEFDDHTHNMKDILPCIAVGRIHSIDERRVIIDSWYEPEDASRMLGDTVDCFAIIRATIHKMTRLVDEE